MQVNIALLTVTDTRTFENDKSGSILVKKIKEQKHNLVDRKIVKDEKDEIKKILLEWTKKNNLDVIDFWVDTGIEPEVGGSSPVVSPNGQPNVCWIIRWPSKEDRDLGFAALKMNEEWQEIWSKHPNENSYLHKNVRFMKAIG